MSTALPTAEWKTFPSTAEIRLGQGIVLEVYLNQVRYIAYCDGLIQNRYLDAETMEDAQVEALSLLKRLLVLALSDVNRMEAPR